MDREVLYEEQGLWKREIKEMRSQGFGDTHVYGYLHH